MISVEVRSTCPADASGFIPECRYPLIHEPIIERRIRKATDAIAAHRPSSGVAIIIRREP